MSTDEFNLDAYFRRIDYAGVREPTYAVLEALHLARATHIPFENIDTPKASTQRTQRTQRFQSALICVLLKGY